MRARTASRIAASIACVLLLSHCAQEPLRAPADARPPMSDAEEIELGKAAHQAVLREHAAVDDPALQAYVSAIGKKLAAHSARPALPWQFNVLDSGDVNAFSLPGGYVYLTRGILAYLSSEAELAAIIAHEIAHVDARHGLKTGRETPAGLASVLAPESEQSPGAALPRTLAHAWAGGYGREDELEAHRLAAQYLAAAGYRASAIIDVATALKNLAVAGQGAGALPGAHAYHATFDGHPNDRGVAEAVAKAARSVPEPREARETYLRKLDGLHYGDSPEQGSIRANRLLHDRLGLTLRFPDGWQVHNRADRVVAVNPAGDALVELQPGPKRGKPLDTLQKGVKLDAGARYDSGELGGYPAAFAAGAQNGKPVVVAAVVFNGAQYLIAGMTRDAAAYERERAALRTTINSFRAITPAERKVVRAYTLQTITVEPGQTMADLAKQSPLGDAAETQLRLLNALYPDGEPAVGQLLKIVR